MKIDATTKAGYDYVRSVNHTADDRLNLMWRGWGLRQAFIAGAEWQQKQGTTVTQTQSEVAYENLVQMIRNKFFPNIQRIEDANNAEDVAEAIKAYVLAEVAETVRAMVKSHVLL